MFKKKNIVSKLWLKYTNRANYKTYKWELQNYEQTQYTNFLFGSQRLNSLPKIKALSYAAGVINFTHSGNAGDIIYALPTLKKIHQLTGAKINLYFILGKPLILPKYSTHPLGNVMLNQPMADMLIPLISAQAYISNCETYTDQKIDVDLDYFRSGLVPQDKGNIARWCGYITGVNPDLWIPWLAVTPNKSFKDHIIIARSARYQNKIIDYRFLNKYSLLKFVGVESEYQEIRKYLPKIEWVQVSNFMDLAQIIAGCKFFIGNQSFPYAIAEALKIPRILEVAMEVINVVPEGENAFDFLFQDHFETLVDDLYTR